MYLNVVRYSLAGTVVRSAQKGIKQLYEFKRIRWHNMFDLTRQPSKERVTKPGKCVPACDLSLGHVSLPKMELQ